MKNLAKIMAVLLLAAVVGAGALAVSASDTSAKALGRLRAELMGHEVDGVMPQGEADWRMLDDARGNRLKVDVEDINLPDGTVLDVLACGTGIGEVLLEDGEGDIDIREERGDKVPMCEVNDEVSVMHASSTILFGTFMDEDEEGNEMDMDMDMDEDGGHGGHGRG